VRYSQRPRDRGASVASRSREKTTQRYSQYRFEALQSAMTTLAETTQEPLTLTEITWSAIEAWKRQWAGVKSRKETHGGWNWEDIRHSFRRNPKRFEVAAWSCDRLCGLAVGRLNRCAVAVDILEGNPDPNHPLRGVVLLAILQAATTYAQRTGRREIWLMEPAEGLVSHYQSLGFSLETPRGGKPYCRRRV